MELLAAGPGRLKRSGSIRRWPRRCGGELDLAPGGKAVALRARLLARPTNLPTALTSFVGRGAIEMDRPIADGIGRAGRTVGDADRIGGSGKTRLALEVGAVLLPHYAAGVAGGPGAGARPGACLAGDAEALAIQEQPEQPLTAVIVEALRDRQVLLVLDTASILPRPARTVAGVLAPCRGACAHPGHLAVRYWASTESHLARAARSRCPPRP